MSSLNTLLWHNSFDIFHKHQKFGPRFHCLKLCFEHRCWQVRAIARDRCEAWFFQRKFHTPRRRRLEPMHCQSTSCWHLEPTKKMECKRWFQNNGSKIRTSMDQLISQDLDMGKCLMMNSKPEFDNKEDSFYNPFTIQWWFGRNQVSQNICK